MNSPLEIAQLIDKYHQGLLSEEERILFEEKIQKDPEFAEQVKMHRMVDTLVHSAGLDMLREQMSVDLKNIDKNRSRKKWWTGGGLAGVLLLVGSLIYFGQNTPNKEEVGTEEQNAPLQENSEKDSGNEVINEKGEFRKKKNLRAKKKR